MKSLLKRWLHTCGRLTSLDLRLRMCDNGTEDPEPTTIPTRYLSEELASEFAKYWTNIREPDGERLETSQLDALLRWHAFRFEFGTTTEDHPLPLDYFFDIFDDFFFLAALRLYTAVGWEDETPANSGWVGVTRRNRSSESSGRLQVQIGVRRLRNQLWTRKLVQDLLDTLLHEMTHAFLMIYGANGGSGGAERASVVSKGLTGHGTCWVKVAEAVAAEADRSLGGIWDKWDLGIADACSSEKEALDIWDEHKGLNLKDEESN